MAPCPPPPPTSSLIVLLGEEGACTPPARILPGTAPSPAAGLREEQEGGRSALQEKAGAGTKERGAEEDAEPQRRRSGGSRPGRRPWGPGGQHAGLRRNLPSGALTRESGEGGGPGRGHPGRPAVLAQTEAGRGAQAVRTCKHCECQAS